MPKPSRPRRPLRRTAGHGPQRLVRGRRRVIGGNGRAAARPPGPEQGRRRGWLPYRHDETTAPKTEADAMQAKETTDRTRWIALYVLCVGVLMIVLDATVVNVALPTIQTDLGFTQASLAWVVNAYLIAFGGLLLLAGRLGDLLGRRSVFLFGLGPFTLASLVCGVASSQEMLVGARFVQGLGGAMTSAVIARDDRDDVPRAARAGEGDRRVRVRRVGRRVDRAAGRRHPDAVDQLALDLLHQHPVRDRHRRARGAAGAARCRTGLRARSGRARGVADHRRADAGGLHDRQAGRRARLGLARQTLGFGAARWPCWRRSSRARRRPPSR